MIKTSVLSSSVATNSLSYHHHQLTKSLLCAPKLVERPKWLLLCVSSSQRSRHPWSYWRKEVEQDTRQLGRAIKLSRSTNHIIPHVHASKQQECTSWQASTSTAQLKPSPLCISLELHAVYPQASRWIHFSSLIFFKKHGPSDTFQVRRIDLFQLQQFQTRSSL